MKLLLHGLNYAPEQIGIGKYSGEMVSALAEQGWHVSVVTTSPYYPHWKIADGFRGSWYQRRPEDQRGDNIEVIRCPLWVPRQVNGWKRIVHLASFGLSSIPVVLWQALARRPDVVMVIEPAAFCLPSAWLAARLCGAKAWLHIQDFEIDAAFELGILKQPLLKKLALWCEAFWMRRFDRVSSISPNMVARLEQKGVSRERICLFPNWVDCHAMRPLPDAQRLRAQFGIPPDKCVALYAGNIGAKQGLEIIEQAARLGSQRPDIHFVICGRGAAFPAVSSWAEQLGNVQLLPVQPSERFNELMNAADIHLLPQRCDAADLVMPSKLTGMLATGRPVVACAAPGTQIAEVVHGHGSVVPPGDGHAFYQAIVALADDPDRRCELGAAAREYAVAHLSQSSILARFAADMRTLCAMEVFGQAAVDGARGQRACG